MVAHRSAKTQLSGVDGAQTKIKKLKISANFSRRAPALHGDFGRQEVGATAERLGGKDLP